ncbi:MAG: hypothetical protein WBM11_18870 [Terriglobales bacterium]
MAALAVLLQDGKNVAVEGGSGSGLDCHQGEGYKSQEIGHTVIMLDGES